MRLAAAFLALLGPFAPLGSAPSPARAQAPFRELSFADALAEAARRDKAVFVDFFTTWCGPCKKLDALTWTDPAVRAWLEAVSVPLKLDAEREVELARRYAIGAYPTLLFLDREGRELDRIQGFVAPGELLTRGARILAGESELQALLAAVAGDGAEDPHLRQKLGMTLAQRGQEARGLEHLLWSWDHGLLRADFAPVRGSLLLGQLARLAKTHPPAREALELRRAAAADALRAGDASLQQAEDLVALDRALGRGEDTLASYDELRASEAYAGRPELARALQATLYRALFERLADSRRYEELLAGLALEEDLAQEIEAYRRLLAEHGNGPQSPAGPLLARLVARYTRVHEAQLATGRVEDARATVDALLALAPGVRTYLGLASSARRAGSEAALAELLERARRELPPRERDRLERQARRAAER